MQQIEIEVIGTETGEARFASARDAVFCDVIGLYLRDQEYAVALVGKHLADQFLGAAITVIVRRVN
jgi:hypothetical protein